MSLEDNLFRIFGGDRIKGLMTAFQIEDLPIESQMLTNALDEAQRKVESYFFDIRKQLFEYDQVLNTQRDKVRCLEHRVLLSCCAAICMLSHPAPGAPVCVSRDADTRLCQVYGERRRALLSSDLGPQMVEYAERTVDDILEANVDAALPFDQWPLDVRGACRVSPTRYRCMNPPVMQFHAHRRWQQRCSSTATC